MPDRPTVVINLRASAQARDLIDSAAAVEGKNRTEFMLDSCLSSSAGGFAGEAHIHAVT